VQILQGCRQVQKIVEAYDRLQTDEDEGSRRSVTG
jgi:hypothetical protein